MAWKTTGIVTDVGTIVAAVPADPKSHYPRQYAAQIAAAQDIINAPGTPHGPWTVELRGSQGYPTGRVEVYVSCNPPAPIDPAVAISWASHHEGIIHASAVDVMVFDDPTTDPTALAQFAAAKAAAAEIVAAGVVGDIRPYGVRLAGSLDTESWEVTVNVHRPLASGYPKPTVA